jgi:hypothetical protein
MTKENSCWIKVVDGCRNVVITEKNLKDNVNKSGTNVMPMEE